MGQLRTETNQRVLAAGVDPALVVRFGLAAGANIPELVERLNEAGLQVVSIDGDKRAVVAFRADDDLADFERAMTAFGDGPLPGRKGSKWDVLQFIEPESLRRWGRQDRLGPRLRGEADDIAFEPEAVYKLDIEMWHPGSVGAAEQGLAKLRRFVEARRDRDARVLDTYVGRTLCLVRVALRGRDVDELLEVPDVAEVDLPPLCEVESTALPSALAQPFPVPANPPADGPRLCILDSGITARHPLLGPFVGHASSVHSSVASPVDLHGHGTAVAGVAVFGDIRGRVTQGDFASSITVFSARMLDDGNQLDEDRLVVNQIREAVERYRSPPYHCRVFNLSFGEQQTFLEKSGGRQGLWAEALDLIAAEYDVIFVVSTGNVGVMTTIASDAEALYTSSGRHLAGAEHRLVDPATSALAITVGAIAERALTTTPRGAGAHDIRRPVAPNPGDPAPYTRVGPGVSGALKPEFVDDGGNLVWSGFGQSRRIHADEASSVLLLAHAHRGITGWFRHDIGTSFAAPRVARVASMIEHELTARLGRPPTGNLVRALLGASAVRTNDVDGHCGPGATTAFTGYGRVDEDFALASSDQRVVLFSEDELPLDHFGMFEIPVPEPFLQTRGRKQISVAVAYDPPTRARRAEYLGVALDFDLYWGAEQDRLYEHYRTRTRDEGRHPDLDGTKVSLDPGPGRNAEFKWARARSTLQVGRYGFQRNTRENRWWLVVRIRRRWAPREYAVQRFAIAVVLESGYADLYARVQAQLRARGRGRART